MIARPAVWLVGLAVLFLMILSVRTDIQASEHSFADVVKQGAAQEWADALYRNFFPLFSYVQHQEESSSCLAERQLGEIWSMYGYYEAQRQGMAAEKMETGMETEHTISLEEILKEEAQETETTVNEVVTDEEQDKTIDEGTESIEQLLKAENAAAIAAAGEEKNFVPHMMQNPVNLQELSDYETLVKKFYTVDKNTMAGSDQLDVGKLLGTDLTISKEGEQPQILIYHTHSQEAFSDSVSGDASTSIVGVGEHLKEILESEYGYKVLHHIGQYDVEARDDAYSKALPGVEQVLAENPSIQVVIDLHRDEMPEETKLVMELDGRPTARFMFFNGLSRTKKTGNIAYLYNENQADNLAFSFQMQLKATEYYPGLVRKIYLKGYRYNMHLKPRTLLIELGAQNNTVEEAMNACDPIAHILDMVLSGTEG